MWRSNLFGVIYWKADGTLYDPNDKYCEMAGCTREELQLEGLRAQDIGGAESADRSARAIRECLETGAHAPFEKEFIRKDGTRLTAIVGGALLPGFKDRGITFLIDVTDRRQGLELQSRLAAIVESSDDAIVGKSLDGNITSWNSGAEALFGYTREEMLGRNISLLIPIERRPEMYQILDTIRNGGRVEHFETQRVRKDGKVLDISLTVSPIRDATGTIIGASKIARNITDRMEAEAALRRQETELRLITDSIPVLISYLDSEEHYLFNNRAYELWFQQDREVIKGKHISEVVGAAAYETIQPYLRAALNGETVHYESWISYKTRGDRYIQVTYIPDLLADGTVRGAFVLVVDETDQRRAQEALARNEERFRLALEAGNMGDWSWDAVTDTVYFPARVREMFDMDAERELTLGSFLEVVHPDDRQRVHDAVYKAVESKTDYDAEYRALRRDGSQWWAAARGRTYYDTDGKPLRMVGVVIDVTERRQAIENLAHHTEIVETLYRVGRVVAREIFIDDIVQVVCDEATAITGAKFGAFFFNVLNDQGESYMLYAVSGVPREEFSKFPMPRNTEIFGPTFRGEGVVRLDDVTKDPRYGKMAPHYGMPAGHLPVASYLAVPVVSRSGEVLGGLFFGHPEAGMFDLRDERIVGGIAAQAAVALDNARLYKEASDVGIKLKHRTEELETAVHELEAFSYSVSHDLRAPLRAVDAFSNIVDTDYAEELPAEARRYLRLIRENSARMNMLITDLLAFSRLSRQEIHDQKIDLEELARQAYHEILPLYPDRDVEITYTNLPKCRGDSSLLKQVFVNLISNALKYSAKCEHTKIVVGASREGDETVIYVKDNGVGFRMKYADKLFKVFSRLHSESEYEGTGVGLAIVHRIVSRHGGRVWAEAEPDQGATFFFTIGSGECE